MLTACTIVDVNGVGGVVVFGICVAGMEVSVFEDF